MDIARRLEKLITVYFKGENYIVDGTELTRKQSRILAYELIHILQKTEMIQNMKRKM
ncbi:hypothetical protein MHI57_17910 [Cytobacillus sp. FSL K6-0129]|uniref:hypothetical protein n=1 Tax=Cytobacillus sp. FSL K6-0129 TaxID=2921421 RepID=UPI0030FBC110